MCEVHPGINHSYHDGTAPTRDVPCLRRIHIGIGRAARLAGVVQGPLLGEAGVIRHARGEAQVVGLRVVDGSRRVHIETLQQCIEPREVGLGELEQIQIVGSDGAAEFEAVRLGPGDEFIWLASSAELHGDVIGHHRRAFGGVSVAFAMRFNDAHQRILTARLQQLQLRDQPRGIGAERALLQHSRAGKLKRMTWLGAGRRAIERGCSRGRECRRCC